MTTPDLRLLLAADEPLLDVPAGFGPRVRQAAQARRRHRTLSAAGGVVVLAGALVVAVPWGASSSETLSPAPTAAEPDSAPAGGEVLPALDVPPCVNPDGYGRISGVPGQSRGPEQLADSVDENFGGSSGFLPEVEQALVDTAPPSARIDCASEGTVVFLVNNDGSYVEIRTQLGNPLTAASREEYYTRSDVETYRTPGGAYVRLEATSLPQAHLEVWAGRYEVNLSSRQTGPGAAGLPLAEVRAWGDRLGDRLVEESDRRGEVPVDLIDRTPNPPPQAVVDRLIASAPDGAVLLPPDRLVPQQVRVGVTLPDGRSAALGTVVSTTNPRQTQPLTVDSLLFGGYRVEDERDGWPPGLLVVAFDLRGGLLINHADEVQLNFSTSDPSVVSAERVRQWARDVVEGLD